MVFLGDTGQGAIVSFGSSGAIAMVRSMTCPDWSIEKIDASTLDNVGFMKYISGDLADPGELVVEMIFDPQDALFSLAGCGETIIITWPIDPCRTSPGGTGATLTGDGFITTMSFGSLEINQLNTMTITFSFNGLNGPSFTPES